MILDADGINAFAGRLSDLAERSQETILTPHPGELGRLLGRSTREVVDDRLEATRRACDESGAIIVLKGHLSLVADPLGGIYVNPTGNPGMATGGSGDVLAGMIGSFCAQGHEPLAAARLAVFLHGLSGDLAADSFGELGLAAGDLIARIPEAIARLSAS